MVVAKKTAKPEFWNKTLAQNSLLEAKTGATDFPKKDQKHTLECEIWIIFKILLELTNPINMSFRRKN